MNNEDILQSCYINIIEKLVHFRNINNTIKYNVNYKIILTFHMKLYPSNFKECCFQISKNYDPIQI